MLLHSDAATYDHLFSIREMSRLLSRAIERVFFLLSRLPRGLHTTRVFRFYYWRDWFGFGISATRIFWRSVWGLVYRPAYGEKSQHHLGDVGDEHPADVCVCV